jgi:hypothetical protein
MIHFIHNRGITLLNQIVEAIDDSFEKIVVSLDDIAQPSRGGIRSLGYEHNIRDSSLTRCVSIMILSRHLCPISLLMI